MAEEILLARQAMALLRRSEEPLIETLEDIFLKTPAGSQPLEPMGGPDQEEEPLLPSIRLLLGRVGPRHRRRAQAPGRLVRGRLQRDRGQEGRHRRSRPRGLRGVGWGERGPSGHVLRKAPQRLSGERCLFTEVRGRGILRSLALRVSTLSASAYGAPPPSLAYTASLQVGDDSECGEEHHPVP